MRSTKINSVLNRLSKSEFAYPVSVHPSVGELLYSLARNINPDIVVEIGSFIGYSSLCFAQAIKDNNKQGKVFAIDPFLPHKKCPPFLDQDIDNPLDIAINYSNKANLNDIISFQAGYSQDIAEKLLSAIDKIDILYIDGDHTYKGMLTDYNLYHHKVRKGGLIVVHDIYPQNCGWWGPRIFLDTLKRSYLGKRYEIIEMDTPDGFGLAILKKNFDGKKIISDNFLYENLRKFISFLSGGGKINNLLDHIKSGGSFKDFYNKV